MKKNHLPLVTFVVLALSFNLYVSGLITQIRTTHHNGVMTVGSLSIYETDGSTELSFLNWTQTNGGNPLGNSTYSYSYWIKNDGNTPSTITIRTLNWNPSDSNLYLRLSSDANNTTLQPSEKQNFTFQLSIEGYPAPPYPSQFSFDVQIIADS